MEADIKQHGQNSEYIEPEEQGFKSEEDLKECCESALKMGSLNDLIAEYE